MQASGEWRVGGGAARGHAYCHSHYQGVGVSRTGRAIENYVSGMPKLSKKKKETKIIITSTLARMWAMRVAMVNGHLVGGFCGFLKLNAFDCVIEIDCGFITLMLERHQRWTGPARLPRIKEFNYKCRPPGILALSAVCRLMNINLVAVCAAFCLGPHNLV